MHLQDVTDVISALGGDVNDLEPSGCGVNHSEAVQHYVILFLWIANGARTNEIDAQCVPWYSLRDFRFK